MIWTKKHIQDMIPHEKFLSSGRCSSALAQPVEPELESFEHVTICSPIWVFTPCGPIKAFCRECAGRIRSVSYIISHYNNTAYTAAADELDEILGVKHTAFRSVRCRQGVFKTVRQN